MSLVHLLREPEREPEGALVLNHGRGTDEHDLYGLLDEFDPERPPAGGDAGRSVDRRPAGRTSLVHRAAGRLPRPRDLPHELRAADRLPRRAARSSRDHLGSDRDRRLLDGSRDVLRGRAWTGPSVARRDRGPERVRPDRRGLAGGARHQVAAARAHPPRTQRPDHRRELRPARASSSWSRRAWMSTTSRATPGTRFRRSSCRGCASSSSRP